MGQSYGDNLYVFIDASNVWAVQKTKGKLFNLLKLQNFLKQTYAAKTIRIFYYTAYPASGTRRYSIDGKHKFFTYLSKGLGFEVRKKELKRIIIHSENGYRIEEKGNMDVEMTIDAIHNLTTYDTAIFFSGDSDFIALITYLKNAGKKVFIYSSKNNVSQELRTGSHGYFDVLHIKADIWGKDLKFRHLKK